jgi:hypothetical protein
VSKVPGTFKHRPGRIIEMSLPPILAELNPDAQEMKVYRMDECSIIVCREPYLDGLLCWHLSISHLTRYPTWDEIKVARYALTPADIVMAMVLPRTDEYVNVPEQDNVFHLHEIPSLPVEARVVARLVGS